VIRWRNELSIVMASASDKRDQMVGRVLVCRDVMESLPGATGGLNVTTEEYSYLPLPLGEGCGEGLLRRATAFDFFAFECHSPLSEHNPEGCFPRLGPHPRPFSQGEKGEKLMILTQTDRKAELKP
jgi:hypothetical protein